MKYLKTFESSESEYSNREEMCDYLCKCGYSIQELENCPDHELEMMCRKESGEIHENESMSREEMCDYLCKCGYSIQELENCPDHELEMMCRAENDGVNEAKKNKNWIAGAIKKPGALRKKMKKAEGEKISKSEINSELAKLKKKDKDPSKKGVQGLSKKDLTKFKQLNLAKTLKGLKEHQETQNYMFFANLETIHRSITEILEMDRDQVDQILTDGHGWALDHIATSKDDVQEVCDFLHSHLSEPHHYDSMNNPVYDEPSHEETEGQMANKDLESEIKSFKNFK
jgi:hypothetical protein